ncbi:hypothetical protein BRDID11004_37280 [Bradyrhizobium diazoefficiens]|nr:hypothetical protein F07S3_51990 [Bradyrhizobium diazoefficiens]BCA13050.1 hypothetical protein BDHF08_48970 [Bradyrhizobium diazoefficiens]BCE31140.1 hypothetical protein XF2B_49090 [Bradyrhizobium diazoefficiens]BCE39994.1 hypothetical protein XF3B_50250 [Bradyrhizobium diazoefficiens]BCE74595.1 hypothetical protein XF8B_47060 [Bradyrhizobium diazoefficiens]
MRRQIQEQRKQFVGSARVSRPVELVIDKSAEQAGIIATKRAALLGTCADMRREFGIEDIGKYLIASVQAKGCAKFPDRRDRQQLRSRTGDAFVRPAADRVEIPACQSSRRSGTPALQAAVLGSASLGVWHALGPADAVLIEADRVDTLREKAATIGIDEPEYAIALGNAEEAASSEVVVDDPSPFRSLQARTPATF